jgi:hypothetical protein
MTRTSIAQTQAFAERTGMGFHFTVIPRDVTFGGSLAFDEAEVAGTFNYGLRCSSSGLAWVTAKEALAHIEILNPAQAPPESANCPKLSATE